MKNFRKLTAGILCTTMVLASLTACSSTDTDASADATGTTDITDTTGTTDITDTTGTTASTSDLQSVAATDDRVAMTIGGVEIPINEYIYYYNNSVATVEYFDYYYYGTTDFTNFWTDDVISMMQASLQSDAISYIANDVAAKAVIASYEFTLTDEQAAGYPDYEAECIESFGGEEEFQYLLDLYYISRENFMEKLYNEYTISFFYDYLLEEGELAVDADEIKDEWMNTNFSAKHILISTIQTEGEEVVDKEAKLALAEEIAQRAKDGEDFDALLAEYGEDPGMVSSPDGYIFGEGEMVTEFEDATKALAYGEISDPVESVYGYHIILRQEISDAYYAELEADLIATAESSVFTSKIYDLADTYEIITEDVILEIDPNNLTDYIAYAE